MAESPPKSPLPAEILAARKSAGLTQTQAAALIHGTMRAWQEYEAGNRKLHPGLWAYFNLRIGNNPCPAIPLREN